MNEVAVDTATDSVWTDWSVKSSRLAPLPESDSRSYRTVDSAERPFIRKALSHIVTGCYDSHSACCLLSIWIFPTQKTHTVQNRQST